MGLSKNKRDKPLDISWPETPIKLLGLYIGNNMKDLEVSNFRHKLQKLRSILNSWKQRNLTLIGKILIVKTLAISQFRYLAQVIQIPQHIINEIQTTIYGFVWNSKQHKVKRNVMIQDYDVGGYEDGKFWNYC